MSDRKMSLHDLAAKVGWEGGILATLEYGITADDIEDPSLAAIWERMERHYGAIREDMHSIDLMLRQSRKADR